MSATEYDRTIEVLRLRAEERRATAAEIATALEEMVPLWRANTASMGDGIDQRAAVRTALAIGGTVAVSEKAAAIANLEAFIDMPWDHREWIEYHHPELMQRLRVAVRKMLERQP